jgi:DNA-directed RNA polymerase specialized sigma24 family protein
VRAPEEGFRNKTRFKGWVRSWTRRSLIKTAIQSVFRKPRKGKLTRDSWWEEQSETGVAAAIDAITQLASVDRFVFVMSVLEGYSTKECSLLLDCAAETVIQARTRTLDELSRRPQIVSTELLKASNSPGMTA